MILPREISTVALQIGFHRKQKTKTQKLSYSAYSNSRDYLIISSGTFLS